MRMTMQALALTLLLGGCNEGDPSSGTRTATHPQGWSIAIPAGREAVETATGFDVRDPDADSLRSPATITVRLVEPDQAANPSQGRDIGGVDIRYAVEARSGGSGGTEYGLTAERPLCGAVLSVRQVIQREIGGTPAFAEAWAVIASATCRADR